jgi:signal transduction histidine kinase
MLMANVLKNLIRESSLLALDFRSFKRQESTFAALNLAVLSVLLIIHTAFSSWFGVPPGSLLLVLLGGLALNAAELIWLQRAGPVKPDAMVMLTWGAILFNMAIAFILASLSYRQDTQYFALLAIPVLQAAFRFSLGAMLAVLVGAVALMFFWVWNYFRLHSPPEISEYLEAATLSIIYAVSGALVWTLVNHLRAKQAELQRVREQLSMEDKLAAVGRFSSAIAHEIRNPVAMIASALSTARNGAVTVAQREEMFDIVANEASRLERLTGDFLAYARPRPPVAQPGDVAESLAYIADICRPHAGERSVRINVTAAPGLSAAIDSGQIQQALLNLVRNAIDASPPGAVVSICGSRGGGAIRVDVENNSQPIPREALENVFEPFFTTKPGGTGLGLAIARNIARAHGGELMLSRNESGLVRFSITLPASNGARENH